MVLNKEKIMEYFKHLVEINLEKFKETGVR